MKNTDMYKKVTEKIISMIEADQCLPWQKSWVSVANSCCSGVSGKPYSLLNHFLLGFRSGKYYTFDQVKKLGYSVKNGSKAGFIVFWKMLHITDIDSNGDPVESTIPVLRYYNVFHQDDTTIPTESLQLNDQLEELPDAESVFSGYIAREQINLVEELSDECYYSPSTDSIHLAKREQFKSANFFYSVAFHESVHSTMKATRCNREASRYGKNVSFGSEEYSKEELVAQLGSAMLCARLGIDTSDTVNQDAAYIKSWLSALKSDPSMIVTAAGKAEKAADYILYGHHHDVAENLEV